MESKHSSLKKKNRDGSSERMPSLRSQLASFLTRWLIRHAGRITLVGALLGLGGAYYSVELYRNLRTDIEELLPTTARSVIDLGEVETRLESIENMSLIIFSEKPEASRLFVDALAAELQKAPRDRVAGVEYKIERELEFFRLRRPLYMDVADLERIRDYIRERIAYERELYNPLNIFNNVEIPEPQLDLRSLEQKYSRRISAYSRFPGGYYATPDGKLRVMLVNLPGKASGVGAAKALRQLVDESIASVDPGRFDPEMRILFSGGVQNLLEEHAALIADLELSTVIVMVLVTGVLLFFFRAIRATLVLIAVLIVGTLWTFGVSYFAVGYLNANSAFLGAIVLGNGVNFGIILLARYLEERRAGRNHLRAMKRAVEATATATWTAALAAGLAYGSLILTGFRGFKQFGVIGLIGMVLCWLATFTVLPAALTLLDRIKPLAKREGSRKQLLGGALATLITRHPGKIWVSSFILTIVSLAMFVRYSPEILETDLAKLRDKYSMEQGSAHHSKYVNQVFERDLTPIVIMPRDRAGTAAVAARLRQASERKGAASLIASVQTIDDFVPQDQPRKIQIISEIQKLLPPKMMKQLSPEDRQRVSDFFQPETLRPVLQNDLPPLILRKFTERDGSIGKLVLVEPPMTNATRNGNALMDFITELRAEADAVEPGAPVAGQLPVTSDMLSAIRHDGPRATIFAFLSVVLLVVFLFRKLSTVFLTLFALFLGMAWMGGAIFGFWIKVNFLNFIALPITFGIGVDYGVNIFQRYMEEGGNNIAAVVRNTGGAVLLASLTTIIGYGSLLIAGNQAFVSFGKLAVLGEITCVLAAVVSLPAYLVWSKDRKTRRLART
jgi:predicted RND superfamily exporter protein